MLSCAFQRTWRYAVTLIQHREYFVYHYRDSQYGELPSSMEMLND
nr:MAG TPA: hypothetical protein [Caudoviricetes sp.]